MTIVEVRCSQIILQKSQNVSGKGPCRENIYMQLHSTNQLIMTHKATHKHLKQLAQLTSSAHALIRLGISSSETVNPSILL